MFAAQLGRSRSGPPLRFVAFIFFRPAPSHPLLTSSTWSRHTGPKSGDVRPLAAPSCPYRDRRSDKRINHVLYTRSYRAEENCHGIGAVRGYLRS